jgi:hypothetical protein
MRLEMETGCIDRGIRGRGERTHVEGRCGTGADPAEGTTKMMGTRDGIRTTTAAQVRRQEHWRTAGVARWAHAGAQTQEEL